MMNVGSLPVGGSALFDLESQAGITNVLLAVRASELSADEKNDIRDLVFLYTNGGKDQSVKLALEQKIKASNLTPTAKKVSATPAPAKAPLPTIGTFRSAPSFAVPAMPVATPVAPAPRETPTPTPTPIPVTVAPVVETTPQPPVVPVPSPVVPPPREIPVPVQVTPKDQEQYLGRIREIKALVNEKVGNPVNLVDINNEVGREYMSALLDAMKRINSGASADAAMARLETAYLAVEATLAHHKEASAHIPQPVVEQPIVVPMTEVEEVRFEPPVAANIPVTPIYQPIAESTPLVRQEPVAFQAVPASPVAEARPVAAVPYVHQVNTSAFSSLADIPSVPLKTSDLPTTPQTTAPLAPSDSLMAPDVEDGLTQLLSEWSIFKKSGIFGTGPKGREHPLYKKMASLQIPLLLAGRFEGATEEVRQSLTDYMNGWRYEQGLIYEKGETFEHYLRRVIRHIIDHAV